MDEVAKLLESAKGELNLEIGSGSGRWSVLFRSEGYIGVELDRKAAIFGHQCFGIEVIVADTRFLPLRGGIFDCVFSFGVVEHFPETATAVAEHCRVARKASRLVISVPNLVSPFIVPSLARSFLRRYDGKSYQLVFGRRFTKRQFRQVLSNFGLVEVEVKKVGVSLPQPLDGWLAPAGPCLGNELFYVLRKNLD